MMEYNKHELDDDMELLNPDGTPFTSEQRYGFYMGLANHYKNQYKFDRKNSYPEIGEQLDMLWHMMHDDVIPGKNSVWYNKILEVKQQYPKT